MFVGTARFVIHIPAAQSLKDRRRVVNKLKDRIRSRLSVSLCEVGRADRRQLATIGLATVARDPQSCLRVIASARTIAETLGDAWLTDAKAEVVSYGTDGENLRGGLEFDDTDGIAMDADAADARSADDHDKNRPDGETLGGTWANRGPRAIKTLRKPRQVKG